MKSYSSFILDRLNDESLSAFIVVDLELPVPYRWVTLPYDVVIDGNTYQGKSGLVSFDMPRSDQAVGRDSYKIVLSDVSRLVEANLTQNGTGAPMQVRIGFLDGYEPNLTDLAIVYKGFVDSYNLQQADETRVLTVQGVSPAGALSYTRSIYTDDDYVKQINSADNSMSMIGSGSAESLLLRWGKIPE
jgi:hypothetical protein